MYFSYFSHSSWTSTNTYLTFVQDIDNPNATDKRMITAILRLSTTLFNKEIKSTYQWEPTALMGGIL